MAPSVIESIISTRERCLNSSPASTHLERSTSSEGTSTTGFAFTNFATIVNRCIYKAKSTIKGSPTRIHEMEKKT